MPRSAYNLFTLLCAGVVWAAVGYKLRDLRRDPRSPALWGLCVSLASAATAYALGGPWISLRVDQALGIANAATLLVYSSEIVCVVCGQLLLLAWTNPRGQVWKPFRWRLLTAGAVVATMTVLFLLAPVPREQPIDFDSTYAATPYISEFLLVFHAALSLAWIVLGWQCWRFAGMTDRLWLRRGLRFLAGGCWCALGYNICMGVYTIGARYAGQRLQAWSATALLVAIAAAPLDCVGLTLPAWGPRLSAARTRLRSWLAYRTLYPLWHALVQAAPEITLLPDTSPVPVRSALRDPEYLDFLLHRLVAESGDGRLTLRPYTDARVTAIARRHAEAAGLRGDEFQAAVEAASLKAAVRLKARCDAIARRHAEAAGLRGDEFQAAVEAASLKAAVRLKARSDTGATASAPVHHEGGADGSTGGGSLAAEVASLVGVARAFFRSPIVTDALTDADVARPMSHATSHAGTKGMTT